MPLHLHEDVGKPNPLLENHIEAFTAPKITPNSRKYAKENIVFQKFAFP
jgi:hypothetical protein